MGVCNAAHVAAASLPTVKPYVSVAEHIGSLAGQIHDGDIQSVSITTFGKLLAPTAVQVCGAAHSPIDVCALSYAFPPVFNRKVPALTTFNVFFRCDLCGRLWPNFVCPVHMLFVFHVIVVMTGVLRATIGTPLAFYLLEVTVCNCRSWSSPVC